MSKVLMSSDASNGWSGEKYSSLLVEQTLTMLENEASRYCCTDYLSFLRGTTVSANPIDECWRQKSAEWMFKVVDYYDLERDIVNVGMTYLDRMFTETSFHHRWSQLQCRLIAMSSLKLAIKLYEPRTLNMEDMIKLGIGSDMIFSAGALVEMEYEILWKLNWNVFPPTAFCFAHQMICMLPSEVNRSTKYTIQELTKYMTELAICVYSFVKYKASSKAFACILVAIESVDGEDGVSIEAKKTFLERINHVFGLLDSDKPIKTLGNALRDLLHHNTDLQGEIEFVVCRMRSQHYPDSLTPLASNTLFKSCVLHDYLPKSLLLSYVRQTATTMMQIMNRQSRLASNCFNDEHAAVFNFNPC
ncbi:hypothetical protein HJC23_012739 [Cyclotella cryptica]|uniref:Uncharacterized protein n=1 Tax=Cyclotella cryptica TaxID=29204 RepID=A0ABD3P7R8_9STRA|eukprot:CCRYP_016778-RA/>CCRYP_016778-RA protein AED:0.04 eAED:0.04 QI:1782/1/1/1/0.66/0.5/4/86/359